MFILEAVNLRCEYLENPIGIDVLKPRLSWQMQSPMKGVLQSAYRVQVAICPCFDDLTWDTGKVNSDHSIHIEYNGTKLESGTRYYYRVMLWNTKGNISEWSNTAYWEMGLLDRDEWKADWITTSLPRDPSKYEPSPMLRKEFELKIGIKSARVYATSLGLYELSLNGNRVGDMLLTPGWTSYKKRLQYQTYDVTSIVQPGKNAIGAMLGDGWYKGDLAWKNNRNVFGDTAALLFQMHIKYEDGSQEMIMSDESWKSSYGPILMSEIYHGETYDARLEKGVWDKSGYDDSAWAGVRKIEHSKDILVAQENVSIRKIEKINPIEIIHTPAGETVIDFGQNMVGYVRFTVQGMAGDKVVFHHAEVLDKDGNFYTENLRTAKQEITYILKGDGIETYEPHFTFQGFRYIKVDEYPGEVSLDNFTGVVIHSDMKRNGSFECSDQLVNKLQHNILWGQKGNFVDVPTDCPQRDERLGWTGDAQVFIRTACFNMNVAPFFTKWVRDLKADQLENGGVPFVIPNVLGTDSHSSSAWGDAAVICPWTIYLCYGDKRILEEQYDSMKAWVEYIHSQGDNEFLWNTGFHYGDWLALDSKEGSYVGATARDFIATGYFAYSTDILRKTAEVLGKCDDAEKYSRLHEKIIENFRKEFVTPNGRLAVPTQTAHVVALMFNLVEDRERVIKTLIEYLEENQYHLTTGFVGTPYLCYVLSSNGYKDAAYKLLMQQDYPSWLYQVLKGATTIWEHWDGIKPDGSFWSKDMNSFNHYAYGSIGDWLYRVTAGIDVDELKPGYKHTVIAPQPGVFSYVKASHESMYGRISSSWQIDDENIIIQVSIPHNTTATLVLPSGTCTDICCTQEGVYNCETVDGGIKVELGSGNYSFTYPYAGRFTSI